MVTPCASWLIFESATLQHQVSYCKEAEQACKTKTNLLALREERQIRSFRTCRWLSNTFKGTGKEEGGNEDSDGKIKIRQQKGKTQARRQVRVLEAQCDAARWRVCKGQRLETSSHVTTFHFLIPKHETVSIIASKHLPATANTLHDHVMLTG